MGLRVVGLLGAAARLNGTRNTRAVDFAKTISTATHETSKEWDAALPFHEVPGPKPLPIVGNAWRFVPRIGDWANLGLIAMNKKFFRDFGKISILSGIPGRKPMLMVFDPDDIEKNVSRWKHPCPQTREDVINSIVSDQFNASTLCLFVPSFASHIVFRNDGVWPIREGLPSFEYYRKVTRREFYEGAGGLVTSQGEEWGKFRSSVNQPMMQPRVAINYIPSIIDVTDDFIKRIYFVRDKNGEMPEDFLNEFYKWGLESISKIALDIRLGCLENDLASDSEPQQMIDCVDNIFDCLFELNIKVPVWRLFSTPTWRRYVKYSDLMNKIVMKYVNLALERLKTNPADSGRQLSVLEQILARNPNPNVACVMAIDMMTAGIDTTTNSTAFLWYHLAKNPDKQKILQEEIDNVFSSKKEPITAENINNLRYLKACIKETMRVSPIIIGNFRRTANDMVLQGYQIPKGTDVLMNQLVLSNMEEYFPQADEFLPERWLKGHPANDYKPHPFVSLPFGFGPRMCIGRRFAEIEIIIATVKIVQNFTLEWHHGPMEVASAFINTCASPLRFKMIDRN